MSEELKYLVFEPKQIWWFIEGNLIIRKVEYLCPYPFHNQVNMGTYDIVIYRDIDEPKRIYREHLVNLIEKHKHITSYEEAKVELIKRAEEYIKNIKEIYI